MLVGLIILMVLLLLLLTPVGIRILYDQDFQIRVRFGFLRFQIYPSRKTVQTNQKGTSTEGKKQAEYSKQSKTSKSGKTLSKPNWAQIQYTFEKLLPAVGRTLARTGRRIRIDPLHVRITFAGSDPADVAILYGKVQAATCALLPLLEQHVTIRHQEIQLAADYEREETAFTAEVGFRLLVADLLILAFTLLGNGLTWLLGYQKLGQTSKEDKKPADTAAAA